MQLLIPRASRPTGKGEACLRLATASISLGLEGHRVGVMMLPPPIGLAQGCLETTSPSERCPGGLRPCGMGFLEEARTPQKSPPKACGRE